MRLRHNSTLFQITQPGAVAHHAKIQPETMERLRTRRVTCTTCDGKGCVGRCKFRKTH